MRLWLKTGADIWEDLSIDDTVIYLTYVGRRVWNESILLRARKKWRNTVMNLWVSKKKKKCGEYLGKLRNC